MRRTRKGFALAIPAVLLGSAAAVGLVGGNVVGAILLGGGAVVLGAISRRITTGRPVLICRACGWTTPAHEKAALTGRR